MIFYETWRQVLAGTKTETTRLTEPRFQVGNVIAVQPGRGKKAIAYIQIDGIRRCSLKEQLPHFTEEGFKSGWDFLKTFMLLNKLNITLNVLRTEVTVYKFHLVNKKERRKKPNDSQARETRNNTGRQDE